MVSTMKMVDTKQGDIASTSGSWGSGEPDGTANLHPAIQT